MRNLFMLVIVMQLRSRHLIVFLVLWALMMNTIPFWWGGGNTLFLISLISVCRATHKKSFEGFMLAVQKFLILHATTFLQTFSLWKDFFRRGFYFGFFYPRNVTKIVILYSNSFGKMLNIQKKEKRKEENRFESNFCLDWHKFSFYELWICLPLIPSVYVLRIDHETFWIWLKFQFCCCNPLWIFYWM